MLKKIYDYYLVKYLNSDLSYYSKAKLTLNFCLLTAFFSLFYTLLANLIHFHISSQVMPTLAVLFFMLAWLIRTKLSLFIINQLYLLLSFISTIILVHFSGGIYSSILPWMAFIPLSANLLNDKKTAYFWLVPCMSATLFFAFIYHGHSDVPVSYDKSYEVIFYALVYNGLTAIILMLSMTFQNAKNKILITLEQKNKLISSINKEMKSKNDEIVTQNEELTQQKEEITAQREFIEIKNRELLNVQDELNSLIEKLTITQQSLERREAENKSILQAIYSAQLLVVELDINGNIIKISQEALKVMNYEKKNIIGKNIKKFGEMIGLNFVGNTDFDTMWQHIIQGNNQSNEANVSLGDKTLWLKQIFFPILNEEGDTNKVMIIAQDISKIKNQQFEIEQQNALFIQQRKEIEKINLELKSSNEKINSINQNLEKRVHERTKNLEHQNKQLSEYAYINAHLLRGPLCSILGLVHLMENDHPENSSPLVYHMQKSSKELKEVVDKITKAIEKGTHFDRNLLNKN